MGTCVHKNSSKDEKTCHVTICSSSENPVEVLDTLVHELCRVVAGHEAKHGPEFRRVGGSVGLVGNPTTMGAGPELLERLEKVAAALGPYPHVAVVKKPQPKREKGRLVNFKSTQGRYDKYRVTVRREHWQEFGPPCDPDGVEMVPARASERGDD